MAPRPLSAATNLTGYSEYTDSTGETDRDDYYADDADLESITSDIRDFVERHGRTYHTFRAGAYPFPNDFNENKRLDWQHQLLKSLFNGNNYFAPLKRQSRRGPKRILDIGCGTGKWCYQMAKEFPHSRVRGIDLSPIQPEDDRYPNCEFTIDDIRDKIWWRENPQYDYIHTRMSMGIFRDFRSIIQKGFNNLEPGGWMESQELYPKVHCDDGTMPPDWPFLEWSKEQNEAAWKLGTPLRIANLLKTWYEQAGFVDVHEEVVCLPVNEWSTDPKYKMYGKFMAENVQDGLYGWSVDYFHRAWSRTEAETRVNCVRVFRALADRSVHSYFKVYIVWGRKPNVGEAPSQTPKPEHWPTAEEEDDDASSIC